MWAGYHQRRRAGPHGLHGARDAPPDRLRRPKRAAYGHGDEEFPELAQLLKQFASPFQYRPACSGPVDWKDWPAAQADIDLAKKAMQAIGVEDIFMTSPSPGQIARIYFRACRCNAPRIS